MNAPLLLLVEVAIRIINNNAEIFVQILNCEVVRRGGLRANGHRYRHRGQQSGQIASRHLWLQPNLSQKIIKVRQWLAGQGEDKKQNQRHRDRRIQEKDLLLGRYQGLQAKGGGLCCRGHRWKHRGQAWCPEGVRQSAQTIGHHCLKHFIYLHHKASQLHHKTRKGHRHAFHEPRPRHEAGGGHQSPPNLRWDPSDHRRVWNFLDRLAKQMAKETSTSKDIPGFIANRLLMPYINEAIFALYEGIGTKEDIDKTMKLGTNVPMGPLTLADFIGLDTCLFIMEVLHRDLGDSKYRPCPLLTNYVSAGYLGVKSGRGFYDYKKKWYMSDSRPLPSINYTHKYLTRTNRQITWFWCSARAAYLAAAVPPSYRSTSRSTRKTAPPEWCCFRGRPISPEPAELSTQFPSWWHWRVWSKGRMRRLWRPSRSADWTGGRSWETNRRGRVRSRGWRPAEESSHGPPAKILSERMTTKSAVSPQCWYTPKPTINSSH